MHKINSLLVILILGAMGILGCVDTAEPPEGIVTQSGENLDRAVIPAQTVDHTDGDPSIQPAMDLRKTGSDPVIFDQGPTTGSYSGFWQNQAHKQNLAEKFSFSENHAITGVRIFTSINPGVDKPVHIKILSDDEGFPGSYLYEEDRTVDEWNLYSSFPVYEVTAFLGNPFRALAHTTYWTGLSGTGLDLGQHSVRTPDDGRLAVFWGQTLLGTTGQVGDMTFQLLGRQDDPPEILMTLETKQLWPPNHKMVRVASGVYAADDHDTPALDISISSTEREDERGAGSRVPDWEIIENTDGSYDIYLRAERSGRGNGRTYTITATAADSVGETQVVETVTVPKSRGGKK